MGRIIVPILRKRIRPAFSEPFDLTYYRDLGLLPVGLNWPTPPTTDHTTNVSTIGQFQSAVADSDVRIVVGSELSLTGDLTITGSNIDIEMPNDSTLDGAITMDGRASIRWTGGNVLGNHVHMWRAMNDLLVDDVYMEGSIQVRESGTTPTRRFALINSTVDIRGDALVQQTIYTQQNSGMSSYEDYIFCNVKLHNANNSPMRLQQVERAIIVESALNPANSSGTGFRCSVGCNDVLVAGSVGKRTITVGRHHLSFNDFAAACVTNARFDGVDQYRNEDNADIASMGGVPNTGVVSSYLFYSNFNAGSPVGISPFTGSGGLVQSWDGSTLPDVSAYGAQR